MEFTPKLSSRDKAAIAVADVMMLMQHRMMEWDFKNWDNPEYVPSYDTAPPGEIPYSHEIVYLPRDFDVILKARSLGRCLAYTHFASFMLHQRYSDHFQHELIVQGLQSEKKPLKMDGHRYQYYFLNQDTSGLWRAGSPANHTPEESLSRLTNIITATTLEGAIARIEDLEGGDWPSREMLNFVLADYEEPQIDYDYKGKPIKYHVTGVDCSGQFSSSYPVSSLTSQTL